MMQSHSKLMYDSYGIDPGAEPKCVRIRCINAARMNLVGAIITVDLIKWPEEIQRIIEHPKTFIDTFVNVWVEDLRHLSKRGRMSTLANNFEQMHIPLQGLVENRHIEYVHPKTWQLAIYQLAGLDKLTIQELSVKERSRLAAIKLWGLPTVERLAKVKKSIDHNITDALLIATYGAFKTGLLNLLGEAKTKRLAEIMELSNLNAEWQNS